MLDILRRGASGWLAKLLMGLLVASFVVWGVRYNDSGAGSNTLAQIGGRNITTVEYQRLFAEELKRMEAQSHQRIDPALAHKFGVDRQIFSGLMIDAQARQLNLGISDQALLERLKSQKSLQGANGEFDPAALRFMLQNLGMTEEGYFTTLRRDLVREQLLGSVTTGAPVSAALVDAFNQFEGEERTIDYFLLPAGKVPAPAKADDAKLKAYFEAHTDQYRAPEYRALGVLLASPEDIKSTILVGDDEAKGIYDATKSTYVVPERRHVQAMSFQDKAASDKAFAALKSGKDFMAVAIDSGLAEKDVDRGLITKADLLDKVVAEAAFKLDKDKVSDPVEGALATSILRVTEIQPGSTKSFDDAKAAIKDTRAREMAAKQLIDYRAKIEDERAGGRTLKEMPAKFPFKYTELPLADKAGLGTDGKPLATQLPNLQALLKTGYSSDIGIETDPIDLGKDGWAWVEVKDVKASRAKTFDEVKTDVEKANLDTDIAAALGKLAGDLAGRANKGEDFAKLAKESGSDVKTIAAVTRVTQNPDLPPAAIQLAFAVAKGGAATLGAADGKARIILRVSDIKPAKPLDADHAAKARKALTEKLAGGLESQYLAGIQQSLGFRVDEAQLNQLTNTGNGETDQ